MFRNTFVKISGLFGNIDIKTRASEASRQLIGYKSPITLSVFKMAADAGLCLFKPLAHDMRGEISLGAVVLRFPLLY